MSGNQAAADPETCFLLPSAQPFAALTAEKGSITHPIAANYTLLIIKKTGHAHPTRAYVSAAAECSSPELFLGNNACASLRTTFFIE